MILVSGHIRRETVVEVMVSSIRKRGRDKMAKFWDSETDKANHLYEAGLCPICGKVITIRGETTDGRIIGTCFDAFTVEAWQD